MARDSIITYKGNCHCGRYRFEIDVPEINGAVTCDCAMCVKKGYLWIEPESGEFRVKRDDGCLTEFQSASLRDKVQDTPICIIVQEVHLHLTDITSFATTVALGLLASTCVVRCLGSLLLTSEPFKTWTLTSSSAVPGQRSKYGTNHATIRLNLVNKAANEPRTDLVAQAILPRPDSQQHETASCYCGKVRAELLFPLSEEEVKEDNCSSCVRVSALDPYQTLTLIRQQTAYVGVYPKRDQVQIVGREHTFEYLHGRKFGSAVHCKYCGVHVFGNIYGPDPSVFDKLQPERREIVLEIYHKNMALQPVNVRTITGLDLKSIHVERTDCGTDGYVLDG